VPTSKHATARIGEISILIIQGESAVAAARCRRAVRV